MSQTGGPGGAAGPGEGVPGARPWRGLASDNNASVHPDVLTAVATANTGHARAYGEDPWTAEATRLLRAEFGEDTGVALVFNGTGANVVGLSTLLRPTDGVVCASSAHISVDECGAPERLLGTKLLLVDAPDGKLTPDVLEASPAVVADGDEHHVQPRVLSVSQSTELGTVYSVGELKALADWAHRRGLWLHVDGARLANAAASLGVSLGDLGGRAGVDVLSLGGTKNGAMAAEAVLTFGARSSPGSPPSAPLSVPLPFLRKSSMQLASKMRFAAAQFVALLTDDLWRRNAGQANAMAARLAAGLVAAGLTPAYPVQANGVFVALPAALTAELQEQVPFYVWDAASGVVRLMASFDTTEEDVDGFLAALASSLARRAGTAGAGTAGTAGTGA